MFKILVIVYALVPPEEVIPVSLFPNTNVLPLTVAPLEAIVIVFAIVQLLSVAAALIVKSTLIVRAFESHATVAATSMSSCPLSFEIFLFNSILDKFATSRAVDR